MNMQSELYDVTIIGGGPVGLFTALYSGMRELRTKIIESSSHLGGRVLLYPDKMIWDIGGIPIISGADLVKQLIIQANTFQPTIVMEQKIIAILKREDGSFELTAACGKKHLSRTVILAIGKGDPVPKKLELEGAHQYEGSSLHYSVQSLEQFKGRRVLISGGGNSAVDWTNTLEPIAAQVTVVHRREQFIGLEANVARMKSGTVNVMTPYELAAVHGKEAHIRKATVRHIETGEEHSLLVDQLLINHGYKSDLGAVLNWGLTIKEERIAVHSNMATSTPGIFAVGDVACYDNKLKLIAAGFTEGPTALNSAKLYLDPQANTMAAVSTHHAQLLRMTR